MACHEEVLQAAKSIIKSKGINEFSPQEVLQYLKTQSSNYALSTINTHIVSRCCINAPEHHAVRYAYFERIRYGLYKVMK
jgi:hypothetical protein